MLLSIENRAKKKVSKPKHFLLKSGRVQNQSQRLATWGGSHALVTTATVPLSRVGFLPVIPSPVTSYATVYKALQNFQKVRHQLNPTQTAIPVVCDEGVYHIVMDELMHEPDAFNDVHAVMGMFHFTKAILRCAGRYLRGSGIEDALIEQDIFGKLTLKTVMEGTHYARSFTGMIMISDMINGLIWEAFWSNREGNGYYLTEEPVLLLGESCFCLTTVMRIWTQLILDGLLT